jgi:hypothetical protein
LTGFNLRLMSADMSPGGNSVTPRRTAFIFPLRVRRRGDNAKDITLVVPPGMTAALRNLLDR